MIRRIIESLCDSLNDREAANKEHENVEAKKAQNAFHLEEYKQLRTEILSLLTRLDTVLQYAVIGSALVYSWIVVQGFGVLKPLSNPCLKLPSQIIEIGAWIPPALVLILGLFALTTWRRISEMGAYLARLEGRLGSVMEATRLGWEHRKGGSGAFPLTAVVWIALIGSVWYATHDIRSMVSVTTAPCSDAPKNDAKAT